MYLTKEISLERKKLKIHCAICIISSFNNSEGCLLERRQCLSDYSLTFDAAKEELESYINYHSRRFGKFSRLNEEDDFQSIALLSIWKSLQSFKPVCPACGKKFMSMDIYKKHTHNGSRLLKPKFSLTSYIKYRILSAFQSEIKKETAQKRRPASGLVSLEASTFDVGALNQEFVMTELLETIEFLLKDFSTIEKAIIRMLQDSHTVTDVILLVEPHGYSLNFVRETIYKLRRNLKSFYNPKSLKQIA